MKTLDYNAVTVACATIGVTVFLFVGNVFYNLFLHPLRKYPGPLLHRATRLGYVYNLMGGFLPRHVLAWHEKYGPVVRIAPDQLAFIDPEAWKDIYGHRTGSYIGTEEMAKSETFYVTPRIPLSIITEKRGNHAILRKKLSHGFSERAMREQEPIIKSYVDLLIQRLYENCHLPESSTEYSDDAAAASEKTPKLQALDMTVWYNWTTFDIIGDLAFGESFHCLKDVKYHPWVDAINKTILNNSVLIATKMMYLTFLIKVFFGFAAEGRKKSLEMSIIRVQKRKALGVERPDFLDGLIKPGKNEKQVLDIPHLASNASTLVLAGSETTATLLSGVTYLLLKNPKTLERLTAEVRSTFSSESEINFVSANGLSYMLACLNEALRCYPPVPFGMPRIVPKGGATIAGNFVSAGTSVACWQWAMNYSPVNWEDPNSFKPERFLEGSRNVNDNLDAMQPFSMGPRNCIGRNLAYTEMRLILARILYNFDIQLADPNLDWMEHQGSYILWNKPQLNVYLKPVVRD
ncbi:cytochrome p450 monooxygenase [Grosmannia clavigera kw1407]|uniref:Cytochrome p450 monooxygenase n=1 Tax=Grosmannia clavigera (strain kw1407 / UAMH 11150) TaxID=655863 RepID=F0XE62_GROCL|nr:cytochrome p450 monooxygenase [Grosmannia clavigera kw1407]EFX04804.1 cytochrome p450 monooxygenase [Grosmannia clavigera kw1407]